MHWAKPVALISGCKNTIRLFDCLDNRKKFFNRKTETLKTPINKWEMNTKKIGFSISERSQSNITIENSVIYTYSFDWFT